MTRGDRVAAAATAQVGTRFRLHGRGGGDGLDCVGLAALSLQAGGARIAVPTGYALRGGDPERIVATIDAVMARGEGDSPGDLLLMAVGPGQLHLAIRTRGGIVHADAALRRVVERPGGEEGGVIGGGGGGGWPLVAAWRLGGED